MEIATERLTQENVFEAANKILGSGEKPSVIKVHKLLGRGSYTTIQKHLKAFFESETWLEATINQPVPDEIPLPNSARDSMELALKTIWSAAEASAKDVLDIRTKAVSTQLEEQEREIEQVINTNAQLSSQLEANQSEIRRLGNELDSANKSNGVLSEKVNTLSSANSELKAEIDNLKGQLRNQAQLEKDLDTAATTIKSLNTDITNLSATNGSLNAQLTEKTEALQTSTTDLKDTLQKLTVASDELEEAHKANAELTVNLAKADTALEAKIAALQVSESSLSEVKEALTKSRDSEEKAKRELGELRVGIASKEANLKSEKDRANLLSEQLKKAESKNEEKELQISNLQNALNTKVSDYILSSATTQ